MTAMNPSKRGTSPLQNRVCRALSPLVSTLVSHRHELRDTSGSTLVEIAVILSLLGIPMLLGTAQLALIAYDSIEITNAAHLAASYGAQSPTFAASNSGMIAAAQADASDFGLNLTATPTVFYACSVAIDGTRYTGANAQSNATSACSGSTNRALEFVQVATSAQVTPSIHCPGLPTSYTLTGLSIMEVQT